MARGLKKLFCQILGDYLEQKSDRSIRKKVRDVLGSGLAIAVIGWRDSNHNDFTRSLPKDYVIFLGNSSTNLANRVGFVLFTRFVSHSVVNRIKAKKHSHPNVINTGIIKDILESNKDLLLSHPSSQSSGLVDDDFCVVSMTSHIVSAEQPENEDLLDFLTQPTKETAEMNDMENFVSAFHSNAIFRNGIEGKVISSQDLRNLLTEFQIKKSPQQLIREGWIEPVAKEGTERAHWYKAGRLMSEFEEEKSPPDTVAGRVEFLLTLEPSLISEKMELVERIKEIDKKLDMITSARKMFNEIDEAFENQNQK